MHQAIRLIVTSLILFICSCKKDTPAQVQTVVETDTVYITVKDTITIPALISDTITTIIVIRHAEKESSGTDPNLDSDGMLRAEELKRIFGNVAINTVYSTSFNRTRQTVQPLAAAKGLTVSEYPTTKPYAELVNEMIAANRGKVAIIAGHSNTVPEILKELTKNSFNVSISESQYDNLYIVSLPDKLKPVVTHLKYGKSTP